MSAPPSKSYAHRMLICASLANGESVVKGVSESDDMHATLGCVTSFGGKYEKNGDTVKLYPRKNSKCNCAVFDCRESASTLRFFIPLSLVFYKKVVFKGTEKLISRGIGVYEELFLKKCISVKKTSDEFEICGELLPGKYEICGNVSSQFASGLLLALPLLNDDSTLVITPPVESRPYIDITLDVMKRFGVNIIETSPGEFLIKGRQHYIPSSEDVEGDWSNAAALYAFNYIGGNVEVSGLKEISRQGDSVCLSLFEQLKSETPVIDISDCPDLAPVLFAVAAANNGATFIGTERLKIKECDRAEAMVKELLKFGITATIEKNRVHISKGKLAVPGEVLSGHNDHRIIMALTLLSSIVGGIIEGAEAVKKSYPDFFEVLFSLGLEAIYEV